MRKLYPTIFGLILALFPSPLLHDTLQNTALAESSLLELHFSGFLYTVCTTTGA